jgi:D-psicose/D-tagatose/L-ribulose 3-epimerase
MTHPLRFALCNEIFQDVSFGEMCREVRAIGYTGVEIAPHTLAEDATSFNDEQRRELRKQITDAGLEFVGLHWLLVSPPGLHITTDDAARRKRSWEYVHRAIDLCADLAGSKASDNGVVVFGSPKQRSTDGAMSPRQAADIFTHEMAHTAPHAETRGVTLLVESLPSTQSDVITCLHDAVAIVKQIGSPAVQTMFDVHNSVEEKEPHAELLRRYFPYIRHVHVNENDGREPGQGDYDFTSLLHLLEELHYSGWVSLEAFDFGRPGREIAAGALCHLKAALTQNVRAQSI